MVSQRVIDARNRRNQRAADDANNIQWFLDEVSDKVAMTVEQRVRLATEYVRTKVVRNISVPVIRMGSYTIRSVPGEFPRADTTLLRKTIFSTFARRGNSFFGYVGTPQKYGVILELEMNRSFLRRTLNEERRRVMQMLLGPIR